MDKNRLFLLRKPKLISRIALYQIPLKFLLKYDDFLPKIRYNKERKTGVSPGGKERKVMKHRKCKRTLCAMLCAAMVASTMCTASFAADGPPAGESSTSSSMSEPPGSSTSSETETLLEESGVPETEESLSADTQQILDANVQKTPAEGNGKRNNAARGSPGFFGTPELFGSSGIYGPHGICGTRRASDFALDGHNQYIYLPKCRKVVSADDSYYPGHNAAD